jgi:hypothetical protein
MSHAQNTLLGLIAFLKLLSVKLPTIGALINPPIDNNEKVSPNSVPVAPNNWTVTYGTKNEKKKNPRLFQKIIRIIGTKSGVILIAFAFVSGVFSESKRFPSSILCDN